MAIPKGTHSVNLWTFLLSLWCHWFYWQWNTASWLWKETCSVSESVQFWPCNYSSKCASIIGRSPDLSNEWLCCRWPWWPLSTLNHFNFYILHCLMHHRSWRSQRLQIWCKGWMCKSQPTDDKLSLGSNHITGTDKPKVVKFCTQVGYINSSNRMTYHQQKAWLWSRDWFKMFAVCRDAARRAGLSATAYPLVEI